MIHKFLKTKVGIWIRRRLEHKNNKFENIHDGESCYILVMDIQLSIMIFPVSKIK